MRLICAPAVRRLRRRSAPLRGACRRLRRLKAPTAPAAPPAPAALPLRGNSCAVAAQGACGAHPPPGAPLQPGRSGYCLLRVCHYQVYLLVGSCHVQNQDGGSDGAISPSRA